jgi:hypothetical protein
MYLTRLLLLFLSFLRVIIIIQQKNTEFYIFFFFFGLKTLVILYLRYKSRMLLFGIFPDFYLTLCFFFIFFSNFNLSFEAFDKREIV